MPTIPLDLESDTVVLPPPAMPAQATLEQALKKRRSTRSFLAEETLSLQTLSTLLWAAFGVNRPGSGGRTAPSAHNWREIEVFAVLGEGAYRYDPRAHRLLLVKGQDLRRFTSSSRWARGS